MADRDAEHHILNQKMKEMRRTNTDLELSLQDCKLKSEYYVNEAKNLAYETETLKQTTEETLTKLNEEISKLTAECAKSKKFEEFLTGFLKLNEKKTTNLKKTNDFLEYLVKLEEDYTVLLDQLAVKCFQYDYTEKVVGSELINKAIYCKYDHKEKLQNFKAKYAELTNKEKNVFNKGTKNKSDKS